MKNIIVVIALVTGFAACNNKKQETRDIQLMTDSSAYNNDMYSDTSAGKEIVETPVLPASSVKSVAPRPHTSSNGGNSAKSSSAGSANNTNTQTTTQTTTKKKGWSSAAKGAVIGAGAGAIGGAVISRKKPVQGAVIGGVVGAAGGYIIGKDIDKKKGR
ncbi:MAG: YMGG-like glycine zipper-containing protein [Ginsengibacter sp.]